MIDLHCHLLPGVDDGSRSIEQSVKVLAAMGAHGITDVCLTPHLEASHAEAGVPKAHEVAFEGLARVVPSPVRLHRGVEMMLDRPLPPAAAENRSLTLAGSRYMLVEFTRLVAPTSAYNALARVTSLGLVPVLAHPERYSCCTPDTASQWKSAGALMQVDANTLFMPRSRGERARQLLTAGLVDILAADNHGDDRTVSAPFVLLCEHEGEVQADLLLNKNPAAILADELTEMVPPLTIRTSLFKRLKQLLDPEE